MFSFTAAIDGRLASLCLRTRRFSYSPQLTSLARSAPVTFRRPEMSWALFWGIAARGVSVNVTQAFLDLRVGVLRAAERPGLGWLDTAFFSDTTSSVLDMLYPHSARLAAARLALAAGAQRDASVLAQRARTFSLFSLPANLEADDDATCSLPDEFGLGLSPADLARELARVLWRSELPIVDPREAGSSREALLVSGLADPTASEANARAFGLALTAMLAFQPVGAPFRTQLVEVSA